MMNKVLIYGGKGALGNALVKSFKNTNKAKLATICSVDFSENKDATDNIVLSMGQSWEQQKDNLIENLRNDVLKSNDEKFDAVLCVAGGWAGGNIKSKDLLKNTDLMWKSSVQTSILSAHIASLYLKENGLLLLPGALGALNGTPGMIGYGVAKAAIHHLIKSLGSGDEHGLPKNTKVIGICPNVLDTEMNRKGMPNADFKEWTPLDELSDKIIQWANGENVPQSGSLVEIKTHAGVTSYNVKKDF